MDVQLKEIESEIRKTEVEEKRVVNEQITLLHDLLSTCMVDVGNDTGLSENRKLRDVFSENERKIIKGKLFQLIEKL